MMNWVLQTAVQVEKMWKNVMLPAWDVWHNITMWCSPPAWDVWHNITMWCSPPAWDVWHNKTPYTSTGTCTACLVRLERMSLYIYYYVASWRVQCTVHKCVKIVSQDVTPMHFGRPVTTVGKHATSTLGGKLIQVLLVTQWYLPNELQGASLLRTVSKIFLLQEPHMVPT